MSLDYIFILFVFFSFLSTTRFLNTKAFIGMEGTKFLLNFEIPRTKFLQFATLRFFLLRSMTHRPPSLQRPPEQVICILVFLVQYPTFTRTTIFTLSDWFRSDELHLTMISYSTPRKPTVSYRIPTVSLQFQHRTRARESIVRFLAVLEAESTVEIVVVLQGGTSIID